MGNQVTQAVEEIILASHDSVATRKIIDFTLAKLRTFEIVPTEVQLVVLANHLGEMIRRSQTNERMMRVDPLMFSEVSKEALALSQAVVKKVGNLAVDEKYVLSIHFETARQNKLN
ncbi:transcriptional regulator [Carnobacterium divergens]|uniref:transcriptional regulator n=1 Tax=Carnobacterium divergens TaxID=2748 RepID=UPI0007F4FBBB|nr:transcriptional regulator [Carnobacterium divergens]SBO17218.1 conserved hypothetical protein [Carnobacterium divergens]